MRILWGWLADMADRGVNGAYWWDNKASWGIDETECGIDEIIEDCLT